MKTFDRNVIGVHKKLNLAFHLPGFFFLHENLQQ